jgi:hypothetical protein
MEGFSSATIDYRRERERFIAVRNWSITMVTAQSYMK